MSTTLSNKHDGSMPVDLGEYNPTDDKWLGWSARSGVALVSENTNSLFCYDEASCNLFY